MADIVSPDKRSKMMSGIRGKNTKPEILVRRGLFNRGYRFRLHVSKLPGKPDIVLPKYRAAIFINGCFWHGHGCSLFKWPSSRAEFWRNKIESNKKHDIESLKLLETQGWRTFVVWECTMKGTRKWALESLLDVIIEWLLGEKTHAEIGEQQVG